MVKIRVKCTYFKSTGKYYTDGKAEFDVSLFESERYGKKCIYPSDYGRRLRDLGILPGLSSGKWNDAFVCEPENSYPELVLPENYGPSN